MSCDLNVSLTGDPDPGPQTEPGFGSRGSSSEEPAAGEGEDVALIGGNQSNQLSVRFVFKCVHTHRQYLDCNVVKFRKLLHRLFICGFVSSKQKEMDKTKSQRDYEEKLIVSAWYNMVRRTFTA